MPDLNKALQINDETNDSSRPIAAGEEAVDGDGRFVQVMIRDTVDPTGTDVDHPIGTEWLNTTSGETFRLVAVSGGVGTWVNAELAPHTHAIADTTGLQTALDGKAAATHAHAIADTTGLQTALDGKAPTSHTHAIADTTGLQTALDGKAPVSHTHAQSDVTNLVSDLAAKQPLDATLTALAGLATGANKVPYSTGPDAFGQLDLDTDVALAANSDTRLATQKAIKAYADTKVPLITQTRDPGTGDTQVAGTLWVNTTVGGVFMSLGSGRWVTMAAQQAMILAEDWITGAATGLLGWTNTTAQGGSATWDSTLQTSAIRGVLRLQVSSGNVNGRAMTSIYSAGTGPYVMSRGIGVQLKAQLDVLGDGTNPIRARLGFCDVLVGSSTAVMANGFWFEYDNAVSANWLLKTAAAGAVTTVVSSTPVVAATWLEMEARASLDNTSVNYSINGTVIGSVSATLPTAATNNFFPYVGITRATIAGNAARSLYLDQFIASYLF